VLLPADWSELVDCGTGVGDGVGVGDAAGVGVCAKPEVIGIITLRNPSNKKQTYALDVAKAFELPVRAPQRYQARSPWLRDRDRKPLQFTAGQPKTVILAPFEVMNLEALPEK